MVIVTSTQVLSGATQLFFFFKRLCNVSLSHRETAGQPSGLSAMPASMYAVHASLHAGLKNVQIPLNILFLCKPCVKEKSE